MIPLGEGVLYRTDTVICVPYLLYCPRTVAYCELQSMRLTSSTNTSYYFELVFSGNSQPDRRGDCSSILSGMIEHLFMGCCINCDR